MQTSFYTPVTGQLGTDGMINVTGHAYVAGYAAVGYGLEEDGVSIASITLTDAVDFMINLDPDDDGIFDGELISGQPDISVCAVAVHQPQASSRGTALCQPDLVPALAGDLGSAGRLDCI